MIRPLNDNVVLKKEKLVRETASGIVLSQKEEEPEYATVVAVSEGKRNEKGEIIP
ncbi:MAG: co-chaperone GroES, partial [Acholeplasmatales bacterium]|nr:co-chaperone GroES [Acholeplasmatales bacterium]